MIGNWTDDTYAGWAPGSVPHTLFRGDRFAETLGRVNRVKEVCAPYYPTLAEAALRYSLSPAAVATVIPGMRNPAEVDMNIAYSDGAPIRPGIGDRAAANNTVAVHPPEGDLPTGVLHQNARSIDRRRG